MIEENATRSIFEHDGGSFGLGNYLVAYSTVELDELKLKIGAAVTSDRLTQWQTKFLVDINSRIDKYGRKVSEKQLAKLDEIVSKGALAQRRQLTPKVDPFTPRPLRGAIGRIVVVCSVGE